jgi:hypothetical protein
MEALVSLARHKPQLAIGRGTLTVTPLLDVSLLLRR